MAPTTRASAESEAYKHSLETLLGLAPDSNVHKALNENGLDQFNLLANLEADDMDQLKFTIPDLPPTTASLNLGEKKNLLLLKWFYVVNRQMASNNGDIMTTTDWLLLTHEEFSSFKSDHGGQIMRTMTQVEVLQAILGGNALAQNSTSVASPATISSSDALAVTNFQRGHKRDISKYKEFKGDRPLWFVTKAGWNAQLTIDGVINLLHSSYVIPGVGTDAFVYHTLRNNYIFTALGNACLGGQAKYIKQSHSTSLDGIGLWSDLVTYYEQPEAVQQVAQEALSKIHSLRLSSYAGGPKKFLGTFQNYYMTKYQEIRDYAPHQAKAMDDGEKIALLNACIGNDSRFASVQNTVTTITKMGGGKAITYTDYIEQLLDASAKMEPPGRPGGNPNPNSNRFDTSKKTPGNKDVWKKDLSKYVPKEEWDKLSKDEQQR
jgi:hypothetical protein